MMAEVLATYPDTIVTNEGLRYRAQACGAPGSDGMWNGWIEFVPLSRGKTIESPRETTQPNRTDAVYWANGLSAVYLEGALTRAVDALTAKAPPPSSREPAFDGPAPDSNVQQAAEARRRPSITAVLNPFSVYEKNEDLLRRELGALSTWHLVNIIVAYELSSEPVSVLNGASSSALIALIVAGVKEQTLLR
jgi:hypothetical protein